MKVQYEYKRLRESNLSLVQTMNYIMDDYENQGFKLTVRQLYYQLVTRNEIANDEKSYDKITRLCNDARMSGLMDWDMLEDRTRGFITQTRWDSGADIVRAAANTYHQDRWANQDKRVFCIVEKDALAGVLEPVCSELDIPLLAARGYPSVTVLREFATNDILPAIQKHQAIKILHLGDHDPSGMDMTRDLRDRIYLFLGNDWACVELTRIALNMDQIEEIKPPKNPAKMTDKRFPGYFRKHGPSSWELDALPPEYLARLVREHALQYIDDGAWDESEQVIKSVKTKLQVVADGFVN